MYKVRMIQMSAPLQTYFQHCRDDYTSDRKEPEVEVETWYEIGKSQPINRSLCVIRWKNQSNSFARQHCGTWESHTMKELDLSQAVEWRYASRTEQAQFHDGKDWL